MMKFRSSPVAAQAGVDTLERKTRFELATSSLARRRSTAELLPLFQACLYGLLSILGLSVLSKPSTR